MTIINKVSNKTLMPGITAIPDVVDAPTIGAATAVDYQSATVAFTAAATGGTATSFTAISTPGSVTGSSATSPITVSGLTDNTSYTFKVYGANSSGTWSAVQSSASNSITTPVATSYESIATVTVGAGGSSSITFSSIPGTYKHLQIRMFAKYSGTVGGGYVNFNSDASSSNYSYHAFGGDGAGTVATASGANANRGLYTSVAGTSATEVNTMIMDILEYANTSIYKTLRTLYGWDGNGSGYIEFGSSNWRSTSAITSITLTPNNTFAQYTHAALYGIKG